MSARLGLVVLVVGCNAADRKLPGASITPHLAARLAPIACGDDVAFHETGGPDIRYRYSFDDRGRMTHATGSFAAGGADDAIDDTYDNLDHLTHSLEARGASDARVEIVADFDTLGDLLDYTYDAQTTYHDVSRYTFSTFTELGQPTRETIATPGQPDARYQLAYDLSGRIAFVVEDGGPTTTYSYDDELSRTTTIDTDNGAFHGVIAFDDQNRELSETWDGTDPSVIVREDSYQWSGDRLLAVTYRSGTTAAPRQLATVEIDTLRYACP